MIITITVTEDKTLEEWDEERFTVKSDYPILETKAYDDWLAINHVKGVALCVVGQYNPVPDKIEFVVVRNGG